MKSIFKLDNPVKHYDWGSPDWIPQFLNVPNEKGLPWAELWMGSHPEGPSLLATQFPAPQAKDGEASGSLPDLIGRDPIRYLGPETFQAFGTLPFLFKLLAAGKPLSIQAHPDLVRAKAGWDRENALGIPPGAPNRNYRDANHKPELLCALTPMNAMAGFREAGEIIRGLQAFGFSPLGSLNQALTAGGLRGFLDALFALPAETRQELTEYARSRVGAAAAFPEYAEAWKLIARFAELYPGDPAIIAPLYLNLLQLNPGEAMFIPAGILHAYIHGFGVELMANSDNVLRGGLTPKHIDLQELKGILRFEPFLPEILRPEASPQGLTRYPAPCREFSLHKLESAGKAIPFPVQGPAIVIVAEGEATLDDGEKLTLRQGESAFIAAERKVPPVLSGSYSLFIAGTSGGGFSGGSSFSSGLDTGEKPR